jgi:uncharacterized protein (TIGR00251 family)
VSGTFLTQSGDSVLITIRVIPRATRSQIAGTRNDALLVRLSAPPVDGAANAELIDVLSDALGVPRRSVTLVSGERSRSKRVRVAGMAADDVRRALNLSG